MRRLFPDPYDIGDKAKRKEKPRKPSHPGFIRDDPARYPRKRRCQQSASHNLAGLAGLSPRLGTYLRGHLLRGRVGGRMWCVCGASQRAGANLLLAPTWAITGGFGELQGG